MREWFDSIVAYLRPSNLMAELSLYFSFTSVWHFLKTIIDLLIVVYLSYKVLTLLRDTRAWQLMKGVVLILIATVISGWLGLSTMKYILDHTIEYIALAFIIIFQPELRRVLEKLGNSSISRIMSQDSDSEVLVSNVIESLVSAADTLSRKKTGALIVIEGHTKLGDIMDDCIELDSKVTAGLLINIFEPNTPLHDGAVIIRDNRIKAAACYLPHSASNMIPKELGTRHRAAIGVSEVSDALVIVVSEETGHISTAQGGNLQRGLTPELLRNKLRRQFDIIDDSSDNKTKKRFKGFISRLSPFKSKKAQSEPEDNNGAGEGNGGKEDGK